MELAARLGARGIDIDVRRDLPISELTQTGIRQIRKWLSDYQLQVACVRFTTRRGLYVAQDLDRRLEAIRGALHAASSLGCRSVSLRLNGWPADGGNEMTTLRSALQDLTAYSLRAGAWPIVHVRAEPVVAVRQLIESLPEESIGVDFDPAELLIHGQDPVAAIGELGRAVRHVRVRDAVREGRHPRGVEVQLGRGEIDHAALLGALEEHRYRGFLTVGSETPGDTPIDEVRLALEFLDHIFA